MFAAMQILKEGGGEMPGRDVLAAVEKRVPLDEWELERFASDGSPRWRTHLIFYTVGLVKSGYLVKRKGIWYLTPEGEKALTLGPAGLLQASIDGFHAWKKQQPKPADVEEEEHEEKDDVEQAELALEEVEAKAKEGITNFINNKNPYEFQNLCAALLRGMGYYTPFVSPKGKDGGVDIIAYRDPLGTVPPRIRVQVKHRESSASAQEIRQLLGITRTDGDVSIFISSGGFTSDAKSEARNSRTHIELIDLDRFIDLWVEFYPKLTDEDKNMLPLLPVYFLAPLE
jgi:restriction system protein